MYYIYKAVIYAPLDPETSRSAPNYGVITSLTHVTTILAITYKGA